MDYKRIYAEFIKDRRGKEKSLTGYTERHHIVPRCLGGGDEPCNLIDLTPEDHFFAHLLLAKIHGGRLWAAVHAMAHLANDATASGRSKFRMRLQFGHVRRGLAAYYREVLSGPDGKIADQRRHLLHHHDGRRAVGNRFELEAETGVPRAQISAILRGAKKTAHGWYSPKHNPQGLTREEMISARKSCERIHVLHHWDGREWRGTISEFRQMTGLALHWRGGNIRNIAGWYRSREDALRHEEWASDKGRRVASARGDITGRRNPNADPKKYRFRVLSTGEVVEATKTEIRARFGISSPALCSIFSGRQRQTGGIALAEEERAHSSREKHSVVRNVPPPS